MLYVIAMIILFIPISLLFPTKVLHKERMLNRGQKLIVTSNHYSNLDVLIYHVKFLRKFRVLSKKELFKNKFVGFILSRLGAIPVDRENMSPSSFKSVMTHLKSNHQVFIFPEGTRNKSGSEKMLDAKSGVIVFASKSNTQIIPMLMYRKPKIFRKNYIIVGSPIDIVGENVSRLTKDEIEQNLSVYKAAIDNLRVELDEYVQAKGKRKAKTK